MNKIIGDFLFISINYHGATRVTLNDHWFNFRIFDSDHKLDMFHSFLDKSILDGSNQNRSMSDKIFLAESSKLCIQIRHSYERRFNFENEYHNIDKKSF